jgi:ATP-binding cassette subfamily B protein
MIIVLLAAESVATGLLAVSLGHVVNDAASGRVGSVVLWAVGASACALVTNAGDRFRLGMRGYLGERVGLGVDEEVVGTTARLDTIAHVEQPEYLDRVSLVLGRGGALVQALWAPWETVSSVVGLVISAVLFAEINPWLWVVAALVAAPILGNRRGHAVLRAAGLAAAPNERLARRLFETAVDPGTGKETRVYRGERRLLKMQRRAWDEATEEQYRAGLRASWIMFAGWAVFVSGYVAGLALVAEMVVQGERSAGTLLLAVTLAAQLRGQVERTMYGLKGLQAGGAVIEHYLWLRDYAAEQDRKTLAMRGRNEPQQHPEALREGITLEGIGLRYPNASRDALSGVSVHLPAGALVSVVGEYGSGKSSLVKLLLRLYQPTEGRILVDGVDLADMDCAQWRGSCSAAFQDFVRYPTSLAVAIGLGAPQAMSDPESVGAAAEVGGAAALAAELPDGLQTRLGSSFGGIDLSEGQWQKVALSRACMPPSPVFVALDEPTAALDAPSERAVFRRFAEVSRAWGRRWGTVTLLVSHRLGAIADADLILVLRDGRLVELGDHDSLMRQRGYYAELYHLHERREAGGPPSAVALAPAHPEEG